MSVGRGVFWKKDQVEDCLALDISRLKEHINFVESQPYNAKWTGWIEWKSIYGKTDKIGLVVWKGDEIILEYTVTNFFTTKTENMRYCIYRESTPCFFGGKRWWFICPGICCERRCRILYMPAGGSEFACRACHNLTYQSTQEGQSVFAAFLKILVNHDTWMRQMAMMRSDEKRQKLERKILRLVGKAQPSMNGSNQRRKRSKKK